MLTRPKQCNIGYQETFKVFSNHQGLKDNDELHQNEGGYTFAKKGRGIFRVQDIYLATFTAQNVK